MSVSNKTRGSGQSQLYLIHSKKKKVRVSTHVNQYVQASIIRTTFHSDLEYSTLRPIAKFAGTTEGVTLRVIREECHNLRAEIDGLKKENSSLRCLMAIPMRAA
jgi:hypothetical protein